MAGTLGDPSAQGAKGQSKVEPAMFWSSSSRRVGPGIGAGARRGRGASPKILRRRSDSHASEASNEDDVEVARSTVQAG